MDESKEEGCCVFEEEAVGGRGFFALNGIPDTGREDGEGDEELNDVGWDDGAKEYTEGEGKGVAQGKCGDEDCHLPPLLGAVHAAECHEKKEVVVAAEVGDVVVAEFKIYCKGLHGGKDSGKW